MEHRELGRTGVEVSRVILGCGNFGGVGSAPEFFGRGESEEEAFDIMDAAWQLEITTFDTADAYGGGRSETMIGNWMTRRGHVPQLVTKTFNPMDEGEDHGLSRPRIGRQIDSSLRRLGSDQVDLYLAHEFDPDVPLTETISTFAGLIDLGLVKAWGLSNVSADQLRQVLAVAQPAAVQNSYSLLERGDEDEVVKICSELSIAYTPFSPLAGGWLTGKYKRGQDPPAGSRMTMRPEPYAHLETEKTFAALERFEAIATRRGVDMSTLAIAWVLAQSFVTAVIVGPRRPSQLDAAARAAELRVSQSEADEIAALFD